MLQAIWDVLANYGLDVTEIAEAMKTLIWFNPDILKAFASAIPNVQLD